MTQIAEWSPVILAVATAAAGAWTDLTRHKIFNKLTIPALFAGLALNLLFGGLKGLLGSLGGIGVGCLTALFWVLGALKAGDVKLFMAVGALGKTRFSAETIVISILVGGFVSLLLMLRNKAGRRSFRNLWNWGKFMVLTKSFQMYRPSEQSSYFCFGGCIAAGALAAALRLCF